VGGGGRGGDSSTSMGAGGGSRLLESANAATEDAGGEWGHEKDRGVRA